MDKIRGVNLGNWLVLEKWMGDSPLSVSDKSWDDHDLMWEYADNPQELYERLEEHRSTYISKAAIEWLMGQGCNLVRVPIPYYICGSGHHKSCSHHLNNLFDWCDELGMNVLIDLHTVPRSQNGTDCGGMIGVCEWHQSDDRVRRTIALLGRIAGRYAERPSFWGIEPLNEPAVKKMVEGHKKRYPDRAANSTAPTRKFLRQFYTDAYNEIRRTAGQDVNVVLHDHYFLPAWDGFMSDSKFANVVMDTHRYPAGKWFMRGKGLDGYLSLIGEYAEEIRKCAKAHPVIVGEWSLENRSKETNGLSADETAKWYRRYADAQIDAWDESLGGCFWSLRANSSEDWARYGWSFVDCVRDGWIDLKHGL